MTNAVSQFIACPKLYIPSSLNIDYILRHLYYRTRAIIGRSRLEAALEYKPYIRPKVQYINGLWKWGKKVYKPRLIMARVRYMNK